MNSKTLSAGLEHRVCRLEADTLPDSAKEQARAILALGKPIDSGSITIGLRIMHDSLTSAVHAILREYVYHLAKEGDPCAVRIEKVIDQAMRYVQNVRAAIDDGVKEQAEDNI